MKNLTDIMITGETQKHASLATAMKTLYYPLAVGGIAAMLGKEVVSPMASQIATAADHSLVLRRIKENYPPAKHGMLEEVFGVITHTAPHMARNYLIAKTLVDQKMAVMEQLEGSHPAGVQIPLPTLEQAISMEKGVKSIQGTKPGTLESLGAGMLNKQAEDNSFETFLAGLL